MPPTEAVTNRCPGNGLCHSCIVESPNGHKSFYFLRVWESLTSVCNSADH